MASSSSSRTDSTQPTACPRPRGLLLNHGVDFEQTRRFAHLRQGSEFSACFQLAFEHEILDEVGNHAVFARGRHDDEPLGSRVRSFTCHQFDTRCVHDRQQFFRKPSWWQAGNAYQVRLREPRPYEKALVLLATTSVMPTP